MAAIDFDLKCAYCGTNLRGLELVGTCRWCLRAVGDTLHLAAIDPDSLTVRTDTLCARCGYNLRTLAVRSVCPECAWPVAESLSPHDLVHANVAWLETVRDGIVFVLLSLSLPILFVLMFALTSVLQTRNNLFF